MVSIRTHWIIDDLACLNSLDEARKWKGLRAIGMVVSERRIGKEVTTETRYYLLSFARDVKRFASSVRRHWGIGAIRFAETNKQFGDGEQGGESP